MDVEGLGRKLLLTPSRDPHRTPEKQAVGTVTASLKIAKPASTFELGRGQAFGCPPAVCSPERPRPFTHYRSQVWLPFPWGGGAKEVEKASCGETVVQKGVLRANLKGAEKKRTLQKHPFGQPFIRTTPSLLLWHALIFLPE